MAEEDLLMNIKRVTTRSSSTPHRLVDSQDTGLEIWPISGSSSSEGVGYEY